MDLKELNQKLDNIKLEKETKEALFDVIDIKINNDMREVISEIKGLRSEMNAFDHKLEVSIGSLKEGNSNLKWVVGISSGAIGVLITILGLLFALKK